MAGSSLNVDTLIGWINATTGSGTGVIPAPGAPNADSTELLQQCLDAAIRLIERDYTLPTTYTADVEQAILMTATRLWVRRNSADGIVAIDQMGAVRVPSVDADVALLLAYYKQWRFA